MIEFDNKKENNLGIPLPKGKVKVYNIKGSMLAVEHLLQLGKK